MDNTKSNSILDYGNDLLGLLAGGAGVYSTFLDAKAVREAEKSQAQSAPIQEVVTPTDIKLNLDAKKIVTYGIYAGVVSLLVFGGYKFIKKVF